MKKDKKRAVPISLNRQELTFIDRCAEAEGMTRSGFILSAVENSKTGRSVRREMVREKKNDVLPGQISMDLDD